MQTPDQTELWLKAVAYEHTQSKANDSQYKRVWKEFTTFSKTNAEEKIRDYENAETYHINERTIKRKHSQLIQQWIINQQNKGLTTTSIKVKVGAVMSFYKYNDLPLGHIPQPRSGVTYHNKDITKDEINKILTLTPLREKAFFVIMAQSGLRPHAIQQLKVKNVERILEFNTPIPCKIDVPREIEKGKFLRHPTFIIDESVKYLKQYLATRTDLTTESLLFVSQTNQQINIKNVSRTFRLKAKKLKQIGTINYEIRQNKPSELRLYTLRKFFRKYANQMGFEHVNYLMGHTTKGSDSNYTPRDDEFYRQQYNEKAAPFLKLETPTATEQDEIVKVLREQHRIEMDTLKKQYEGRIKDLEETVLKQGSEVYKALEQIKYDYEQVKEEQIRKVLQDMLTSKDPKKTDLLINALTSIKEQKATNEHQRTKKKANQNDR